MLKWNLKMVQECDVHYIQACVQHRKCSEKGEVVVKSWSPNIHKASLRTDREKEKDMPEVPVFYCHRHSLLY